MPLVPVPPLPLPVPLPARPACHVDAAADATVISDAVRWAALETEIERLTRALHVDADNVKLTAMGPDAGGGEAELIRALDHFLTDRLPRLRSKIAGEVAGGAYPWGRAERLVSAMTAMDRVVRTGPGVVLAAISDDAAR